MSDYVTPVGRIVEGSVFNGSDKGYGGKPYGMNPDGTPIKKYYIGLAIEKQNPELNAFLTMIQGYAQAAWPGRPVNIMSTSFKGKVVDGDSPEYSQKEGFAGHVIFKMESKYPPTVFAPDCQRVITNPEEVIRGYYIQAAGIYQTNGDQSKPGMKAWVNKVLFKYHGQEIKGTGSDASVFGGGSEWKPAGAMNAPQGFAQPTQPAYGTQPTQPAYGTQPTQPAYGTQPTPGTVTPDFAFLRPQQ